MRLPENWLKAVLLLESKKLADKFKVLFVCTGNTCRTPMAEGILRHFLTQQGIDHIEVSSAGTFGLDNHPASEYAIVVCRDWGIDISGHRSRKLDRQMLASSDLILAMAYEHYQILKQLYPSGNEVHLIKNFPKKGADSHSEGIEDPIGGPLELYSRTFLELDEVIRKILPDIIRFAQSGSNEN